MQADSRQPLTPDRQEEPPWRPRIWRPEIDPERAPLHKPISQMSKLERRQLAGLWTLTDLYEQYVWPHCLRPRGRKPKTQQEHRTSLAKWEAICGHPPLVAITQEMCTYFVARLEREPGLGGQGRISKTTVVKHCGQLQMILDYAGPGDPRRRILGAKLLKRREVPYLQRPARAAVDVQDPLSLDQLGALLRACRSARTPQLAGVDPPVWWTACFLAAYNTGLRRQTLLAARWAWLDQSGWLAVPGGAIKGERAGRFYVNSHARRAIEPLRDAGYAEILPWPHGTTWFHSRCRELFAAAGIELDGVASRRRGLHRFRSTLLTWLTPRNDTVATIVAGHRGRVLKEHYAAPEVVIDLLEQLPQPRF